MAQSIGKLSAQLTLDTSAFLSGFKGAVEGAKKYSQQLAAVGGARRFTGPPVASGGFSASAGRSGGALAGMVGGAGARLLGSIGAAVSAREAIHQIGDAMSDVDRNAKLADRLGVTNEMMQRLGVAAEAAGADTEMLAKAMLDMGRNIGSGGMPLDKRLFQVADAIARIHDPVRRAAAATRIFGKNGVELLTLLTVGSRGIKRSTEAIDRFGLAISRTDAAKVEAANDAITEFGVVLTGLRNKIAVEVAPTIKAFVDEQLDSFLILRKELGGLKGEMARAFGVDRGKLDAGIAGAMGGLLNPLGVLAKAGDMLKHGVKGRPRGVNGGGGPGGLGGAIGGVGAPHVLEKGSLEAAKAISGSGGNPLVELTKQNNKTLTLVERHAAALARKASRTPLRPSTIGGRW